MIGRTHDLAAFVALTGVVVYTPLQEMTLATAIVAFGANFVGGLAPDIDEPTASIWKRVRGGSVFGKLIAPILGSHRMVSHSILGAVVVGYLLKWFLGLISGILLVDMDIVWWAFMIGFISHLATDALTKEGIPLLFPIPWDIGFPPIRALRITTGGVIEKSVIFPGLIVLEIYLIYANYDKLIEFFTVYITK